MRFAGFVLLLLALLCGSAYLFIHNGHSVELRLAENWMVQAPLAAQLMGAFLIGALGVFTFIGVRDSGRAFGRWRRGRVQKKDEHVGALLVEGRRLLWRGEPERGRAILQRAWKTRQTREGLLSLVQACLAADNAGEARRAIESAHEPLADDPEVLCTLADVCRHVGDHSGAISALERARARHPRAERILLGLRDLYLDAQRWSEAAALQSAWLALHPRVTAPGEHTLLAGTRYEAAMLVPGPTARLQALEDVFAHAPRFVPAAVSIGDELAAGGRLEEALRRWESTLRLQPRTVLVERIRTHAQDKAARDRLRNVLRKLRAEHIEDDAIHYHVAQLWLDDGRADHALSEIDALSQRFRAAPAFHLALARLNELRGQLEDAIREYRASSQGLIAHTCNVCQRAEPEWRARCPRCGRWDSLRAAVELIS
jgi:tetratricopeptide (TPR) repeat protein